MKKNTQTERPSSRPRLQLDKKKTYTSLLIFLADDSIPFKCYLNTIYISTIMTLKTTFHD